MTRYLTNYCLRICSRIAALLLVLLSVAACSSDKEAAELIKHPNVLFISLDDMNDWVGPLAGHAQALTPSLDSFAESGVNFTRNYAPSPGCNPSRSATLTGLHTYNSGMYSNYQKWREVPGIKERPDDRPTFSSKRVLHGRCRQNISL